MINGEVMLWRAVIIQALSDARKRQNPAEQERAAFWLLAGGKDFQQVCEFADLDPDAVRDYAIKKILKIRREK